MPERVFYELGTFELAPAPHRRRVRLSDLPSGHWLPAVIPGGVHESLLNAGTIGHPYEAMNETSLRWIEGCDWWYRTSFPWPAGPENVGVGLRTTRPDVDPACPDADPAGSDIVLACPDVDPGRPSEAVELVADGLDTVADVWLNGEFLLHHENQFRPARATVTTRLQANNDLVIRFASPLAEVPFPWPALRLALKGRHYLGSATPNDPGEQERLRTMARATGRRKAMCSWGWDFAPRLPSIGLASPVRLVQTAGPRLADCHLDTLAVDTAARTAVVRLTARVEGTGAAGVEVTLTPPDDEPLPDTGDAVLTASLTPLNEPLTYRLDPVAAGEFATTATIPQAALWWTHDLGTPALYDVAFHLTGPVQDRVEFRAGLRTISLDQSPDDQTGGRYFRFWLNGRPVFARGANWVPPTQLMGSTDPVVYRRLVAQARAANMTMLRVWGGGRYEADEFYDACDEAGLMVWQDFMFACVDYPSANRRLMAEIEAEARYQVGRLRRHPAIALWCGNNEVQLIHGQVFRSYDKSNWGWRIFHDLLPRVVAELDPTRPYWPGSPWGADETEGFLACNGVRDGDRHAWEVWHGDIMGATGGPFASTGESRLYRRYALDHAKFVSEFGIHASPAHATLERWAGVGVMDALHSPAFDHRNKDTPKDKHDPVLALVTGLPATLDEYIDFTQASQAEGLKFGVEHYRRRQPHCSGALVWQLNDIWPGFSWSIIDFDGLPKAGYHAVARAFAPVVATFREAGETIELWLTNSGPDPWSGTLAVRCLGFAGESLGEWTVPAEAADGESKVVWTAPAAPLRDRDRALWVFGGTSEAVTPTPAESDENLFSSVMSGQELTSEASTLPRSRQELTSEARSTPTPAGRNTVTTNRLFFCELRDLALPPVRLTVECRDTGPGAASVTVTADRFAYAVRVVAPPGVVTDDNYIDLPAGRTHTFTVTGLPASTRAGDLPVRGYAGQRWELA